MAHNETWLSHDMMNTVKVQYLDGNVFSMDNAGNLIGVYLTKGGVEYVDGGTISANVIRADGATVPVSGALSGNVATVVLPQSACAIPGVLSVVIKLNNSGAVTTIAAIVANVYQSETDTVVDPGTILPSIETLIAEIEAAVASIPADYSSLLSSISTYIPSNAFSQGLYNEYGQVIEYGVNYLTRIKTTTPIICHKGSKILYEMIGKQRFAIKVFASQPGAKQTPLQESSSWISGIGYIEINYDGFMVINVSNNDNSNILPSDFNSKIALNMLTSYVGNDFSEIQKDTQILLNMDGVVFNADLMKNSELIQGAYASADGSYTNRTDYCCSKIKMPTAPGKKITVLQTLGDSVPGFYFHFFKADGTYLSSEQRAISIGGMSSITSPANCYMFAFSGMHQYGVAMNPADYAFSAFVDYTGATTDIKASNGASFVFTDFATSDFSQGLYDAYSRLDTTSANAPLRIMNTVPVWCTKGSKVYYDMRSSQKFAIKVFAFEPGVYQNPLEASASWITGAGVIDIHYNGYLVMNVAYENDSAITPGDYSSNITFAILDELPWVENITGAIGKTGNGIYYGEKIDLQGYYYNPVKYGSVSISGYTPQSCCIYGNEMFHMYTGSKFAVFDMENKTLSSIFSMSNDTPYLHCNSSCFGNKQSPSEAYPLLYTNSYLDSVGKGVCCVEKITKDGSDYSAQLIQTITIGFTDQEIWTGETINPSTEANGNFIVDTVNNHLIAYTTQGFDRTRFFIFALPDVSNATVTLTQSDILDYFDVAYIANIQDSCIRNGMIYMTAGVNWGDYDRILRIYAINVKGRDIVSEIPLEKVPALNTEPEGIDYYDGSLIMTQTEGNVYQLNF